MPAALQSNRTAGLTSARFRLTPIRIEELIVIKPPDIIDGAVLEFGATEILSPVGAMSPRDVRLCRPQCLRRPAHPRKTPASQRGKPNSPETLTVCWRKRDSNHRSLLSPDPNCLERRQRLCARSAENGCAPVKCCRRAAILTMGRLEGNQRHA